MAIRSRRGIYDNFDPTRMLPGEWAVVLSGDPNATDGCAVYMCFAPGEVKRMATYEDMVENVDEATADVIQAALDGLAEQIAHINAEALPDMSASQRGIAKLGSGLAMANSVLSVDPITDAQIDSIAADSTVTGTKTLNATGLTRLWTKIRAAFASLTHTHAASDITNGAIPVSHGGTGATAAAGARTNLDAAQSESAAGSLYDAEQAIADNSAAIAALGESVSRTARITGYSAAVEFWGDGGGGFVIDFRDIYGHEMFWTFDRTGTITPQIIS